MMETLNFVSGPIHANVKNRPVFQTSICSWSSSFSSLHNRHRHAVLPSHRHNVNRSTVYMTETAVETKSNIASEKSLTVLLIGSGGREHALAYSISLSPLLKKLYAYPGNPGIYSCDSTEPLPSPLPTNNDEIVATCINNGIDLVVIGPEEPLVKGLADALRSKGILAFGPSAEAAQLEGSKVFSKCFLERHDIATAEFAAFQDSPYAKAFARELGLPLVIKAGGLAAGKGVILVDEDNELDKVFDVIDNILINKKFGEAGDEIVIERLIKGEEISFFALVEHLSEEEHKQRDAQIIPLVTAQDHKKLNEGDKGINTGGMGAYSPSLICNDNDQSSIDNIIETVVRPTVNGMKEEGYPFSGILYCGLIKDNETNELSVLEFNVRFGDPECQCLLMRLKSDLLELLHKASSGQLQDYQIQWDSENAAASLVVVMAAKGYPEMYKKGSVINGIEKADAIDGVKVFHAGTKLSDDGQSQILANGGRVLGVTAVGNSIEEAQKKAYQGVNAIDWEEGFCRSDIGWRAITPAVKV